MFLCIYVYIYMYCIYIYMFLYIYTWTYIYTYIWTYNTYIYIYIYYRYISVYIYIHIYSIYTYRGGGQYYGWPMTMARWPGGGWNAGPYIHMRISPYINVWIYACSYYIYIYVCIYIYMYVHIYICIHIYIHICICINDGTYHRCTINGRPPHLESQLWSWPLRRRRRSKARRRRDLFRLARAKNGELGIRNGDWTMKYDDFSAWNIVIEPWKNKDKFEHEDLRFTYHESW